MSDELDEGALNPESEPDTTLETESPELTVDYNKTKELANNQKIRAEKAERELKELKASQQKLEKPTPKNDELNKPQSNEPDYAKLAFLETKGVIHPDDQKVVQDEALRLNLPLTDILQMEHIKSKLGSAKSQREAEAGMPTGSGKPSGNAKNSVDYWVDKKKTDGTYDTPDDLKLANEVIDARIRRETDGAKFSDELY